MKIAEFWRLAAIISKLHHPNILAFYGVVNNGPGETLATVAEFMVNGSLKKVLLRKGKHLDWRKRIMVAMDAAIGMEYLHSKDIVHFDLKCDNLLVNVNDPSRPICKVSYKSVVLVLFCTNHHKAPGARARSTGHRRACCPRRIVRWPVGSRVGPRSNPSGRTPSGRLDARGCSSVGRPPRASRVGVESTRGEIRG